MMIPIVKRRNILKSLKKNYLDFIVPLVAYVYYKLFGLEFDINWHYQFFIFAMYLFPVLVIIKIIVDAVKMNREDS